MTHCKILVGNWVSENNGSSFYLLILSTNLFIKPLHVSNENLIKHNSQFENKNNLLFPLFDS